MANDWNLQALRGAQVQLGAIYNQMEQGQITDVQVFVKINRVLQYLQNCINEAEQRQ